MRSEGSPAFVHHRDGERQDAAQTTQLVEHCQRDSRLATRLRQIHESGHLAAGNVTTKQVLSRASKLNIEQQSIAPAGKLDFSGAGTATLLKLLNDDLFIGGLSKVAYEPGSKARRR